MCFPHCDDAFELPLSVKRLIRKWNKLLSFALKSDNNNQNTNNTTKNEKSDLDDEQQSQQHNYKDTSATKITIKNIGKKINRQLKWLGLINQNQQMQSDSYFETNVKTKHPHQMIKLESLRIVRIDSNTISSSWRVLQTKIDTHRRMHGGSGPKD